MAKFKFRKEKRMTGLAAIGDPHSSVRIKIDKDVVGLIVPPRWSDNHSDWVVRFQITKEPTKESPSNFKWVTLKKRFPDEELARQHLEKPEVFESLVKLGFHREVDDYSDKS
jgi:hypothetical protein